MDKKEIDEIRIKPDGEGGHHVMRHYKPMRREGRHGMQESYMEPESKSFGSKEGHAMLAHVANHLEIPETEENEKDHADAEDKDERGTK